MLKRAVAVLALLAVGVGAVLFVWVPQATERPRHADAIVVLAGSERRLPVALDLFRRGVAPALAISRDPSDEARVAYCRLPARGALCFRAEPYSTRGEARAVARLARRHGWRSIVVVSSRYHLFRAGLLFRRCTDARVQLVPAPVQWWWWPAAVATEWLKLAIAETTRRGC